MAHTNPIKNRWTLLKRGFIGTHHQISRKHLDPYVSKFAGRHNMRPLDTHDQTSALVRGMEGERVSYAELRASADRWVSGVASGRGGR